MCFTFREKEAYHDQGYQCDILVGGICCVSDGVKFGPSNQARTSDKNGGAEGGATQSGRKEAGAPEGGRKEAGAPEGGGKKAGAPEMMSISHGRLHHVSVC